MPPTSTQKPFSALVHMPDDKVTITYTPMSLSVNDGGQTVYTGHEPLVVFDRTESTDAVERAAAETDAESARIAEFLTEKNIPVLSVSRSSFGAGGWVVKIASDYGQFDGEKRPGESWMHIIPKDWKSVVDRMLRLRNAHENFCFCKHNAGSIFWL